MVKVVTVARKEIMAFPRSQRSGKLDKERGRPGCDSVPRRHAPYRVDLILSISRRSPSVTVVTEGGLRWCPLPSAFWWEPPALAGCPILSPAFGERVGRKKCRGRGVPHPFARLWRKDGKKKVSRSQGAPSFRPPLAKGWEEKSVEVANPIASPFWMPAAIRLLVGAPCFSRGELDFSPAKKRSITKWALGRL
jgi:hypothetical protein